MAFSAAGAVGNLAGWRPSTDRQRPGRGSSRHQRTERRHRTCCPRSVIKGRRQGVRGHPPTYGFGYLFPARSSPGTRNDEQRVSSAGPSDEAPCRPLNRPPDLRRHSAAVTQRREPSSVQVTGLSPGRHSKPQVSTGITGFRLVPVRDDLGPRTPVPTRGTRIHLTTVASPAGSVRGRVPQHLRDHRQIGTGRQEQPCSAWRPAPCLPEESWKAQSPARRCLCWEFGLLSAGAGRGISSPSCRCAKAVWSMLTSSSTVGTRPHPPRDRDPDCRDRRSGQDPRVDVPVAVGPGSAGQCGSQHLLHGLVPRHQVGVDARVPLAEQALLPLRLELLGGQGTDEVDGDPAQRLQRRLAGRSPGQVLEDGVLEVPAGGCDGLLLAREVVGHRAGGDERLLGDLVERDLLEPPLDRELQRGVRDRRTSDLLLQIS